MMVTWMCLRHLLRLACLSALIPRLQSGPRKEVYIPWHLIEQAEKDVDSQLLESLEIETVLEKNSLMEPLIDDASGPADGKNEGQPLRRPIRSLEQSSYTEETEHFTSEDDDEILQNDQQVGNDELTLLEPYTGSLTTEGKDSTWRNDDSKTLKKVPSLEELESFDSNLNQSSGDGWFEPNRTSFNILAISDSSTRKYDNTKGMTEIYSTEANADIEEPLRILDDEGSARSSFPWTREDDNFTVKEDTMVTEKPYVHFKSVSQEIENDSKISQTDKTGVPLEFKEDYVVGEINNEYLSIHETTDSDEVSGRTDSTTDGHGVSTDPPGIYTNSEFDVEKTNSLPTDDNKIHTAANQSEHGVVGFSDSLKLDKKWQEDKEMISDITSVPDITTRSARYNLTSKRETRFDFDKSTSNPDIATDKVSIGSQTKASDLERITHQSNTFDIEDQSGWKTSEDVVDMNIQTTEANISSGENATDLRPGVLLFTEKVPEELVEVSKWKSDSESFKPSSLQDKSSTLSTENVEQSYTEVTNMTLESEETKSTSASKSPGPALSSDRLVSSAPDDRFSEQGPKSPNNETTILAFPFGPHSLNFTRGPSREWTVGLTKGTTQVRSKRGTINLDTFDRKFHQLTLKTVEPQGPKNSDSKFHQPLRKTNTPRPSTTTTTTTTPQPPTTTTVSHSATHGDKGLNTDENGRLGDDDDDDNGDTSQNPDETTNLIAADEVFKASSTTTTTTTTTTEKVLSKFKESCQHNNDCENPFICKPGKRLCDCAQGKWYSPSRQMCKKDKFWQLAFNVSRLRSDTSDGIRVDWSVRKTNDVVGFVIHHQSEKTPLESYSVSLDTWSHAIWDLELDHTYQVWMDIKLDTGAKIPTEKQQILIDRMANILNVSTTDATRNEPKNQCSFLIHLSRGCFDSIQVTFTNVENELDTNTTSLTSVARDCIKEQKRQTPTGPIDLRTLQRGRTYDTQFVLKRNDEEMNYNFTNMSCPGTPTNLRVVGRGVHWLRFEWDPPEFGTVEEYRIVLNTRSYTFLYEKHVSDTQVKLESLEQNVRYSVNVAGRFGCCYGSSAKKYNEKTISKVPGKPTSLQYQPGANNSTLSWNKPWQYVDFYKVKASCSMSGPVVMETNRTSVTFQVDQVKQEDCCDFRVWGENELGRGDEATRRKEPTLPADVNALATINISLQNTGFKVRRRELSQRADGIIYEIRLELWSQSPHELVHADVLHCKGYGCVYPCDFEVPHGGTFFPPDKLDIDVDLPMKAGTHYLLVVKPKTAKGEMKSTNRSFTTPEGAPTSPVRDVQVKMNGTVPVSVSWLEPVESNGVIIYYNVSLEYQVQLCNETSNNGSVPVFNEVRYVRVDPSSHGFTFTEYKLDDLHPYTTYSLRVTARNSAGQGEIWTNATTFRTARSPKTGPVRNVIKVANNDSIELKWEEPCPYNGPIDEYHISVHDIAHNLTFELTTPNRSILVSNLTAATTYRVVIGSSSHVNMEVTSLQIKTRDGVPGPVEHLMVTQEEDPRKPRYIYCKWDKPAQTNGRIVYYEVNFLSPHKTTTRRPTETELFLADVSPETKYKIKVAAHTEFARGDYRVEHITVKPGVLPAPKENKQKPLVHKGVTCKKIDLTTSCVINVPFPYMCNESYGQIAVRGVVAVRIEEDDDKYYDPKVIMSLTGNISSEQAQTISLHPPGAYSRAHVIYTREVRFACDKGYVPASWNCGKKTTETYPILIGRSNCRTQGCNQFLIPGAIYKFKAFVCTWAGCTETFLSLPVKTMMTSDDKSSLVVGVVLATIIVVIIVIALTVGYKYRQKLASFIRGPGTGDDGMQMGPRVIPTRPIALSNFVAQVERMHRDSNLLFAEEYQMVTTFSPQLSKEVAEMCRKKNRYTNVLPFDHARVKLLPSDDDEQSDYINASFIPGFRGPREYIAAQGPLPSTVDDFWRMVWEQRVSAVVMLTQCIEKGTTKCEQYWPVDSSSPAFYGDLHVTLRSESVLADYIIRVMDLELGSTKRTVHQFHFLKWPDFGCPEKTYLLLNLVAAVRDHTPHNQHNPTVVHCSAGVGRTGTYIALDVLLRQMREGSCDQVDIFSLVMTMRHNRPLMVQKENQYIYIFDCLRDAILDESEDENSLTNEEDEAAYANCANTTSKE